MDLLEGESSKMLTKKELELLKAIKRKGRLTRADIPQEEWLRLNELEDKGLVFSEKVFYLTIEGEKELKLLWLKRNK